MKILSFINISNENDLECDSGYIFQRIIAKELHRRGHDYHIAGANCKSFKNIDELYFCKHYISWGTNRYSSRYNFNFDETRQLIESVNPDVIFNCQIELTSAIKSVLETMKIRKIPLISYCHYPALWDQTIMYSSRPLLDLTLNDGQVGYNILFNVLTSVITANKVLIQSNYARKLLENAISFYKIPYKNKIGIIQPPVDSFLFDKKNHYNTKVPYMSFLYNHRLYKSYGSENFLSLSDKVIEKYNLESMIFDSMPNRSAERVILNGSPEYYKSILQSRPHTHLINGHVDRYIYKENLLKNLFAMAAFRKTCVWSMAAVDCMCLGLPVIAPNYASYPEFIPQKLLFNSETEALQIIHKLLYDKVFRKKASNQCFNNIKKYEATKICDKLLKVFNKELSKVCVE